MDTYSSNDDAIREQDLVYLNEHLDIVKKYNDERPQFDDLGELRAITRTSQDWILLLSSVSGKTGKRYWRFLLRYVHEHEHDSALPILK